MVLSVAGAMQLQGNPGAASAGFSKGKQGARLSPEVNRILFVRNLPFKVTTEELYELFGKFGAIRQIRIGVASDKKGTAFVVYEDIYDAKNSCEHLNGYNFLGRYMIVLYFQAGKVASRKAAEH